MHTGEDFDISVLRICFLRLFHPSHTFLFGSLPASLLYTTMPKKGGWQKEYELKRRQAHDRFVSQARASIDNRMPRSMHFTKHGHLRRNLKREQMMEARYAEIHRDNQSMLKNMSDIYKYGNKTGGIESRDSYATSVRARAKGSLMRQNDKLRRINKGRIRNENQHVRERIRNTSCLLKSHEWEADYRRHRALSRHMSGLEPEEKPTARQRTIAAFRSVRAATALSQKSAGGWGGALATGGSVFGGGPGLNGAMLIQSRPGSNRQRLMTPNGEPGARRQQRPSTVGGWSATGSSNGGSSNGARRRRRNGGRRGGSQQQLPHL